MKSQDLKPGEIREYSGHAVRFALVGEASYSCRTLFSAHCITCDTEIHPGSTWAEYQAKGHAGERQQVSKTYESIEIQSVSLVEEAPSGHKIIWKGKL